MRAAWTAIAVLGVLQMPALAGDLDRTIGHSQSRAFWLTDQAWPNTSSVPAKITADPHFGPNYTDTLAARFGMADGHADFFERPLGGTGKSGPALAGTFDHGAAKMVLRWHPGE